MITDICDKFWEEFFNDVKNNNVPTDTYKEFKEITTKYFCERLGKGIPVTEVSVWIAVPIDEFKETLEKTNLPSLKYWKLYEGGKTPKWLYEEGYIIERWNYSLGGIAMCFNTSYTDFIETLNRIHLDCKEHYFMGFAESSNPIGQVYEYFFECNPNLFDEMFRTLQPTKLKEKE